MINKALVLTIINIAGRLINFLLFLVIANKFGATANTDWFFLNYGIVYFFVGILFNASEYTLVPIWNKTTESYHPAILSRLFGYTKPLFLVITTIIFLVSFFVSPALGVEVPTINFLTLIAICLILSMQPVLAYSSSIFSSYLQYKRNYILPTIHLAIRSIGILPIILLNICTSVFCLAASFLSGEILRFIFLYKKGYWYTGQQNQSDHTAVINRVVKGTAWMSVALALVVANPLIDLAMVGALDDGSVSLVEYAGRLRGLPVLAFNGVLILLLGEWANQHAKAPGGLQWKNVARYFYPSILLVILLVLLLITTIDQWINLVFFSSKFTGTDIESLKKLLQVYFIGIPMLIGAFILTRVIIIFQQYKLFTAITFAAFIMNILLNFIFINRYGINGVALSTTLVDSLLLIALLTLSRKLLR